MLFHSLDFALLLIATLIIFYFFPPKTRIYLLSLSDILFYIVSGVEYLLLFIVVSAIVYFCALRMIFDSHYKKIYLWTGILIALSNLIFFKYIGFILTNINHILHLNLFQGNILLSHLILPIGISFYTFQLVAYLVDVFKEKIEPCRSILTFWVFVSFFGHLIAGPIMRGKVYLPQIEKIEYKSFQIENMKYGFYYIVLGLIKKTIFADTLAPKVDFYFSQTANLNSLEGWFAAYLFAFQLYFDFSAYSDMAVGIGRLFGLKLDVNFRTPYISANATEFWKRWHITLSNWIKDYVYIPLGGSRKGLFFQCLFIIAAMTVSGIWHGASWTFVIWGLYHGLLITGHKIYTVLTKNLHPSYTKGLFYKVFSVVLFFQLTTIGWVFFRVNNINEAFALVCRMIKLSHLDYHPVYLTYFLFIALLYLLHLAEYFLTIHRKSLVFFWDKYVPEYLRAAIYTIILLVLILFIKTEQNTFIYFQF